MDELDRVQISLLAHSICELAAHVGRLNAIAAGLLATVEVDVDLGEAGADAMGQHARMKEELLDVYASALRVADHFHPPRQPEGA